MLEEMEEDDRHAGQPVGGGLLAKAKRSVKNEYGWQSGAQSSIPAEEPGPEPEPPAPKGPTLIVGSKAIISARISMTGFGTVLS